MTRRVQLRDLISDRFLREIHHLLWTDPGVGDGKFDPGWGCRDHAWATALLVQSFGHKPLLMHGEAFFAAGPNARSAGHSITQEPHSWVGIMGVGAIDLSIKPSISISGLDIRFPVQCVFANEWIPRGRNRVYFTGHANEYARLSEDLARRRNHASAVYLTREVEQVHRGHLTCAAGWIRSMLTRRLDEIDGNPSDLYSALLLHLRSFLEGDAPSLASLPVDAAWRRLAETRKGAIDRACQRVEAALPAPRHDSPWLLGNTPQEAAI